MYQEKLQSNDLEKQKLLAELEADIIKNQTEGMKAYDVFDFLKKFRYLLGVDPTMKFTINLLLHSYMVNDSVVMQMRLEYVQVIAKIMRGLNLDKLTVSNTDLEKGLQLSINPGKDTIEISVAKPGGN